MKTTRLSSLTLSGGGGPRGRRLDPGAALDVVAKGTDNLRLPQQLSELNRSARIIVHAELLTKVPKLYAAGADYVTVPRLLEAVELFAVIEAAQQDRLGEKRAELDAELRDRQEIIP